SRRRLIWMAIQAHPAKICTSRKGKMLARATTGAASRNCDRKLTRQTATAASANGLRAMRPDEEKNRAIDSIPCHRDTKKWGVHHKNPPLESPFTQRSAREPGFDSTTPLGGRHAPSAGST